MSGAVFADTSGLYAVLDRSDRHHRAAATIWSTLLDRLDRHETTVLTHSGVIVETAALVQHRLGMGAAQALHDTMVPLLDVVWIGPELHRRAVTALLAAHDRAVSLVDWTSFEVMRDQAVADAFTFDHHYEQRGFERLEPST